jgi:hypothetical protein
MNDGHSTRKHAAALPSPLRAYARAAIEAAGAGVEELRAAVLRERLAEYFRLKFRTLDVPPALVEELVDGAIRIVDAIDAERPPTSFEIGAVVHGQEIALARGRVRIHGRANAHELGAWRPDPDRPGSETIACLNCGAGATLHLATAGESISPRLLEACS